MLFGSIFDAKWERLGARSKVMISVAASAPSSQQKRAHMREHGRLQVPLAARRSSQHVALHALRHGSVASRIFLTLLATYFFSLSPGLSVFTQQITTDESLQKVHDSSASALIESNLKMSLTLFASWTPSRAPCSSSLGIVIPASGATLPLARTILTVGSPFL